MFHFSTWLAFGIIVGFLFFSSGRVAILDNLGYVHLMKAVVKGAGEAGPPEFALSTMTYETDTAARYFEQALQLGEAPQAQRGLVYALRGSGKIDEQAVLMELPPEHRRVTDLYWIAVREPDSALSVWSQYCEQFARHLIGEARRMAGGKASTENVERILQLVKCQAWQSAEVYYDQGRIYQILGKTDQAIDSYRRAIDIDPSVATYWYQLGTLLSRTGQLQEAEQALLTVLQISPDHPRAPAVLANVYYKQDRKTEAIEMYQLAVTRIPSKSDWLAALILIADDMGRDDIVRQYTPKLRALLSVNRNNACNELRYIERRDVLADLLTTCKNP